MADIEPFHVMDLLAKARLLEAQGQRVIHMEIGEPDFVTPPAIVEAGIQALQQGKTHYTPAIGLTQLRQAIAADYAHRFGTAVPFEQIVVTPGASGALMLILGVLIDPGDKVLMADPGYPCNRHFVRLMEGNAVGIPVDASSQYQLTVDMLARHWDDDTVAVMVASPSNPTGTVMEAEQLKLVADFVAQKNGYLIVDEIYHSLIYDGKQPTAANLNDNVFVINSFSKYFNMTGWRLGWLVAPPPLVRPIDKLAQNIFLAPPTIAQHAALAAFSETTIDLLEQRRLEFQQRRNFLLPALRQIGFNISVNPQGAFYLYADCSKFTDDSFGFCQRLLEKAGVAITPGADFGVNNPKKFVRFAYTTSMENLEEGVHRIQSFLKSTH